MSTVIESVALSTLVNRAVNLLCGEPKLSADGDLQFTSTGKLRRDATTKVSYLMWQDGNDPTSMVEGVGVLLDGIAEYDPNEHMPFGDDQHNGQRIALALRRKFIPGFKQTESKRTRNIDAAIIDGVL